MGRQDTGNRSILINVPNHFKTLLVLALVLALPLRGAAALAGALCECVRHGAASVQQQVGDEHADHGTSHSHVHEAAHDGGHHDPSDTHPHAAEAAWTCSACATCCLGQALPSAADLGLIDCKPVNDFYATAQSRLPDAMPSGMERPPRSI